MVRIHKIYTKTGDDGSTGLVDGSRVLKSNQRVESYGTIDELSAYIGQCRTLCDLPCSPNGAGERTSKEEAPESLEARNAMRRQLQEIANELFDLGAELATPSSVQSTVSLSHFHIEKLENWIDEISAMLPPLTSFVLPGGTMLNASLHIARTVCRRAEREIVKLREEELLREEILLYVNRLSDFLFALCRYESHLSQSQEYLWQPLSTGPKDKE